MPPQAIEFDWPKEYRYVDPFPVEIWILILSFIKSVEAFPVALVCKLFYEILAEQKQKRGDCHWSFATNLAPFCRTPKLIQFVYDTCHIHSWQDTKNLIARVLVKQQNYVALLGFVGYGDYFDGLYDTLIEQGAFDVVRKLLKDGVRTPVDFIKPAIKSGQLDLVKTAHNGRDLRYILDKEDFWNAIKTGNIDIIKLIYEICISFGWERFYVSMDSFVRTGNLDIVKFANETMKLTPYQSTFREALQSKYIDIVEYLLEINCPILYI